MKAEHGCAGCIIDDIAGAVKLMKVSPEVELSVINACMKYLSAEFNFKTIPSTFITGVHRIAKDLTGQRLPFAELRENCNRVGLKLSDKLASELGPASYSDLARFEKLIRWVIASNHLDFRTVGTGYEVSLEQIEEHVRVKVAEELSVNDVTQFFDLVTRRRTEKVPGTFSVLFIHDNVGEIAFDRLLAREMRAYGWQVTSALRGGPITSDATLEDGAYVHLEKDTDIIICAGPDTLGISWEEKSPELTEALKSCDLIVSKGQANFYLFSEYSKEINKPIMCLLTTKCAYVSSYFSKTNLISVAKLLK